MNLINKIILPQNSKKSLLLLSLLLFFSANKITFAKTSTSIHQTNTTLNQTDRYIISQNTHRAKYDSQYYLQMIEADNFAKQGNLQKVRQIQSTVKPNFEPIPAPLPAQVDVKNLSPAGRVYWRHANDGMAKGLKSKIFVPLNKLTENSPDFIPGHLLLIDAYEKYEEHEKALSAIERLAELYPEQSLVVDKRIALLAKNKQYLEASIAARQFTLTYPNDSRASHYQTIAEQHKKTYLKKLRENAIASGIFGTFMSTAVDGEEAGHRTAMLLLMGEAQAGKSLAEGYKQNYNVFPADSYVSQYVDRVGQKLAKFMGRDEFEYEFFVVQDDVPNASALPGGKIFINTGMLQLIGSEAELAGILSHEIAHSVLSHSFEDLATKPLTKILPFQAYIDADMSRKQEKKADILGTRVLASAGYSADGLYNIMAKLKQLETKTSWGESLLSTHPASEERMRYLEEIIQRNGYNRYGYEGVKSYRTIFSN